MHDIPRPPLTPEKEAIHWACEHFPAKRKKSIRDQPWSKIYKLASESEQVYLKVVPPELTCAPLICPILAAAFPENVPQVIASDAARGLLLMRPHNGVDLEYGVSAGRLASLVATYARLQAKAASMPELIECLPRPNLSGLLTRLLEFLRPDGLNPQLPGAVVSADYFLGAEQAESYYSPLVSRGYLLEPLLTLAETLPVTLNHGDLRPPNVAFDRAGHYVLYDWDDAVVGPAGMSLHGLFGGCSTPTLLLAGDDLGDRDQAREQRQIIDRYVTELAAAGYADAENLRHCLSGSMLAGMLQFLLNFSKFPMDRKSYRKAVRRNLQTRLSDLLDLCDFLSLSDDAVLRHAHDYRVNHRARRAEKLLQRHLWANPNDIDGHLQLACVFRQRGNGKQAAKAYRIALELDPTSARAHHGLGDALTERLQLDEGISSFRRAICLDPANQHARRSLNRAFDLKRVQQQAGRPDVVPTLTISAHELNAAAMDSAKLELAISLFSEFGVLVIENLFDRKLISACRQAFLSEYQSYFEDKRHGDALGIGDKRFQVTLDVRHPFNAPALYGNALLLPVLERMLDDKFVIGSIVSATSLPGSADQRLHKDHPSLFGKVSDQLTTPSFAVNVMIPMQDLTQRVGATKFRKGSHVVSSSKSKAMRSQTPFVALGSCYLMDYRLSHRGEPNLSDQVRPVLSIMYQRPWFRDHVNFRHQAPFRITEAEYRKVPENLQRLFAWTLQPAPYLSCESDQQYPLAAG